MVRSLANSLVVPILLEHPKTQQFHYWALPKRKENTSSQRLFTQMFTETLFKTAKMTTQKSMYTMELLLKNKK